MVNAIATQKRGWTPTQCYVDESIHSDCGFAATAFVFASGRIDRTVARALKTSGLQPNSEEFKSRARMDSDHRMVTARSRLLALVGFDIRIAVYFGPFERSSLGQHCLQALQSILVRNGIQPTGLAVYFDQGIFPSTKEGRRIRRLFRFFRGCRIFLEEDSRQRRGIQIADAVASSFGQILKEELTGKRKMVDIGGPDTGYPDGTQAPLGWQLLMGLRYGLLTRQRVYGGDIYDAATDPVIIDPLNDDPLVYDHNPILLGWGVQVSPIADDKLRICVERALGRTWRGCIH